MRIVSVLVPVKSPAAAKSRLSPVLAGEQRALLQGAMLEDMIGELQRARRVSAIALYGPAPETAALALRHGAAFLPQPSHLCGLNEAVADGCARLAAGNADLILVLPGDLPLIRAEDVDAAIGAAAGTGKRVVIPDRWRRGTNGLAFAVGHEPGFRFGADSFAAHMSQDDTQAMVLPSLAFDIDTPDDLRLAVGARLGRAGPRTRAVLALQRPAARPGRPLQEMTA
ncbi:hypothetical protein ASD50_20785 [Mesorhizobium sp. Root552]|jgi:2-phospho-L-lactate guanylyltransferase|uniref:2-phospho-L-lactate guanylyltransferase n=1 Tax=Mesorhizobium sp. Root552 TaxID=1736555 RepID=UPI0007002780|nr:2-phospho-L-lactate guanylyltransferase [Mesorhizobium sp. Root552]KQZ25747.1 hypothetical protein ASD50_20785 [Mesorhizobium sp. Root552]